MQRYSLYALFIIFVMICSSACTPTIHFTQRINNPGFRERGEAKLTTAVTLHDDDTEPDKHLAPVADAAYAITNHIGVMASFRSIANKHLLENNVTSLQTDTSFGGKYNGHYFEAGTGYYFNFSELAQIEIYAGGGMGYIRREGNITPQYNFNSKYYKLFIQPTFNVIPGLGRYFKVGTGVRIAVVDYYDFNAANPETRYVVTNTLYSDAHSRRNIAAAPFFYLEPFINVEGGYKFIKLNVQLSGSTGMPPIAIDMGGGPCFSFGLAFSYAARYFKK